MNLSYTIISDLSEMDFDDLYERSRDAIDLNWPAQSTLTDDERKAAMVAVIQSGLNNEWPGLNAHSPADRYVAVRVIDLDTGKDMSFTSGFVLPDGTFDGRHTLTAAYNGSRNWLYSEQLRLVRNDLHASLGVTKSLYRNIPANSIQHRHIRMRAGLHFEILEDVESSTAGPNFRNILVQYK